jgi:serine/threonine-protein kinase
MAALQGPLPLAEALHIAREVAHGLDHAYASTDMTGQELGVIHGDVAPHNIMISYDGAVKVVDFGVVMSIVGSRADVQYLAPEVSVEGICEHRSDLFSLGVLLYMLCSCSLPFPDVGSKSAVKKMKAGKFRALETIADIPPELGNLVSRLLAFNIDDRPHSAAEVIADLSEIARRHGLESSGPAIGAMVTNLFPADRAPADEPRARVSARMSAARLDESQPIVKPDGGRASRPSMNPTERPSRPAMSAVQPVATVAPTASPARASAPLTVPTPNTPKLSMPSIVKAPGMLLFLLVVVVVAAAVYVIAAAFGVGS